MGIAVWRVSGNIPNYGVSGNVPNYGVSGNIPNYGVSGNVPNYGAPVPTYPAQRPNVQPQIQAQPGMQGGTSFQPVPAQAGQVPGGTPSQPGGLITKFCYLKIFCIITYISYWFTNCVYF